MILDGVVPFVRGTLAIGDSVRTGWFMLDTDAYTSILSSDRLSPFSKLAGELRVMFGPWGGRSQGPTLAVGGHAFSEVNYSTRRYDGDTSALGLLGNDLLKRFKLIVDNRQGSAHFRRNANVAAVFRNPERMLARVLAVSLVVVVTAAAWYARRRRARARQALLAES